MGFSTPVHPKVVVQFVEGGLTNADKVPGNCVPVKLLPERANTDQLDNATYPHDNILQDL